MRLFIFLLINFAALGIGAMLMGNPATNQWYQGINKAPWTPPGWVFGFAWTTIMICFSIFLWKVSGTYGVEQLRMFYIIYALQVLLNVAWNPTFFRGHMVTAGLIIIIALTILVAYLLYWGMKHTGLWGLLMLPYFLWLLVATSLNGYVLVKN